jgi:hypothetical protein
VRAAGIEYSDPGIHMVVEGGEHDSVCNSHDVVTLVLVLFNDVYCLLVVFRDRVIIVTAREKVIVSRVTAV